MRSLFTAFLSSKENSEPDVGDITISHPKSHQTCSRHPYFSIISHYRCTTIRLQNRSDLAPFEYRSILNPCTLTVQFLIQKENIMLMVVFTSLAHRYISSCCHFCTPFSLLLGDRLCRRTDLLIVVLCFQKQMIYKQEWDVAPLSIWHFVGASCLFFSCLLSIGIAHLYACASLCFGAFSRF